MKPIKVQPAILIGGASRRMGRDKSLLRIDGIPNSQRLYQMATIVFGCPAIFCGQKKDDLKGEFLADAGVAKGPMDALIALGQHFPDQAVCLIACDLVRLRSACLNWLKDQFLSNPKNSIMPKNAAGFLEPTLAIYHPSSHKKILKDAKAGQFSLQRLKINAYHPSIPEVWFADFLNANYPEDWPD